MAQTPCIFRQTGKLLDHTPDSDVAQGAVIVKGTRLVTIAPRAIASGVKGAVAADGIWLVPKTNGDFAVGDPVYWDDNGSPYGGTALSGAFSKVAADGPFAGFCLTAAGTTTGTCEIILQSLDAADELARSALTQDDLQPYSLDLTQARVHDARITILPATAANDDMAIITGTPGTDAPTLQGVDFGGTTTDEKCAFTFALPPEYVTGETIQVKVTAAMLTTVSDGTATVDCECWVEDGAGAVGADICATAAQSINSLTPAVKTFVITPTSRAAGDVLQLRFAFAGSDTGNVGVMIPEISKIQVCLDIKG